MSIEFVVEDGTGLSDATTYISEAEFKQFWENKGKDYSARTSAEVQAALNNAVSWMGYSLRFLGRIKNSEQALDFPRMEIVDKNDRDVSGTVPKEVKDATAFLAEYVLLGKKLDIVQIAGLKGKSIGPVRTDFASTAAFGSPQIRGAMGLLAIYVAGPRLERRLK